MKLTGESKFFAGILIFTVVIIGVAAVVLTRPEKPPTPVAREELIPPDAHTKGNASASAYLVEFSDFQCPACRAFAPTVETLTEKHKDSLFFAYRHYPLSAHQYAVSAAQSAEAAAQQGKFWEMSAFLFTNQDSFSDSYWEIAAQAVGLDTTQFKKDMASQVTHDIVTRDTNDARSLNLPGTPSFFLNGILLKDLLGPEDLVKAVEKIVQ